MYIFQDVSFFDRQFTQLGSYDRQETVMQEAQELIHYWIDEREFIDRDIYTDAEQEHLEDVKAIFHILFIIFIICLVLFVVLTIWLALHNSLLSLSLLQSFGVSFVVFGLLVFMLFVGSWFAWDWLFDAFHRLFFVDNRTFSSDSFLIQSYPWQFFRNAMVAVILRTFVGLLLFVFLFGFYRRIRS